MNKQKIMPDISIVIPAFNEAPNLLELIPEIVRVLSNISKKYEILIINDGSTDDTYEICESMIERFPEVKYIELLTNYGKSTALNVGFAACKGKWIITMDADFQDDPHGIPDLINLIDSGNDIVVGWKKIRKDPLEKRIASIIFNKITSIMTGLHLHDYNCGLKAYKRNTIRNLYLYGDLHRFIPVLLYRQGYKITEVIVNHQARKYGKSKFGSERYFKGLFDLLTVLFLTNYKSQPLHLFGKIGFLSLFLGICIDLYLAALWFMGYRPIGDRPLLTLGTLLIIIGIQTILSGLLAELLISLHIKQDDSQYKIRLIRPSGNMNED